MALPKVKTLNFALVSGEVGEVESVKITTLDEGRGLIRVLWEPKESLNEPGKVIYRMRWEGSRRMLEQPRSSVEGELRDWLLEVLP
jgi:glucan biosynthesis protein